MNIKKLIFLSSIFTLLLQLTSCTGIPDNITAVHNLKPEKYLGKWYEIARFDHSFERGLDHVSAEYTVSEDNGINVLNKGYNTKSGIWKTAKGKAYFIGKPNIGRLKVTFFWPFYGSYNIIDIDNENYSYALVCGYNKNYLWILSRTKKMQKDILNQLIRKAALLGFDTNKFIFVKQ